MVEISFIRRFLYYIDDYYIWPLVFCWQVHVRAMFKLSPITTTRRTMTTNEAPVQNMLLLTYNILPHKTCLKLGSRILNKGAKMFFASTHGAWTLVDFYTYLELNKDTFAKCQCESMAYKAIKWSKCKDMVEVERI
jgi:hypothetical protein